MTKCHFRLEIIHWVAGRLPVPITCEFAFDSRDPLAATLIFDSDGEYPVRWVLARDLLTEGFTAKTGGGDVTVWPDESEGESCLWIQVGDAAASHTALFEMPAQPVARWLDACYALVPRGTELADVDWDQLTQLTQ
jgi:hypothetical protein